MRAEGHGLRSTFDHIKFGTMRTHSFSALFLAVAFCITLPGIISEKPSEPALVLREKNDDPLVKVPVGAPSRTFEVGDFDRVSISSILQAVVRTGDRPSVAPYGPAELVEHLNVEHSDDAISISLDLPNGKEMKKHDEIVLLITTPALEEMDASGITKIMIEEVRSAEFDLSLSGISEAQLVRITCNEMEIDLSGTAIATIAGETGELQADVSGASQLNALGLQARKAPVEASGASAIELQVKDELCAEASGASNVKYTGSPAKVEVNSTGMAMINVLSH